MTRGTRATKQVLPSVWLLAVVVACAFVGRIPHAVDALVATRTTTAFDSIRTTSSSAKHSVVLKERCHGSFTRGLTRSMVRHASNDSEHANERSMLVRKPSTESNLKSSSSRRHLFGTVVVASMALVATTAPTHADATYSAYTHREDDWKAREKAGDIKVSSARSLRKQLNEIAPMNAQNQIFCPNGPTAAVSPLMENRCGDRMATPSVYGRSDDVMGNSIPGFSPSWTNGGGSSSSSLAEMGGGFTDYGFTSGRKSSYSIK